MFGRIAKTLTAASAAVVSLGVLAQDGWTTDEKYAAAAIILGVAGVFFIPNADPVGDSGQADGEA